jgi:hypothetical protein
MRTNLLAIISLFCISILNSQVTSATFSNVSLYNDGTCNSDGPSTLFEFYVETTYVSVPGGNYYLYLTDCQNNVLDVQSFGFAINETQYLAVYADPACSDFKIFVTNDFPVLVEGQRFSGIEIGTFEFDPNALDSDCPSNKLPFSQYEFIFFGGSALPEGSDENPSTSNLPDVIFECPVENVIAEQNMRAGTEEYGLGAYSDPTFGQIMGDGFIATETGFVTDVCWYGAYVRGDRMVDTEDEFTITYYDNTVFLDNNGMVTDPPYNVPGNIIGGPFAINNNDIVKEKAPFLTTIFGYSTKHDPVPVTMGEKYWVVIKNEFTDNDYWVWMISQDYIDTLNTLEFIAPRTPNGKYYPAVFPSSCTGCEGLMFTVGYSNMAIPTLSEWGLIVLLLLMVVFGSIILRKVWVGNSRPEVLHKE